MITKRVTKENVSDNSQKETLSSKEEEDDDTKTAEQADSDSKAKIKLNKGSRPFNRHNAVPKEKAKPKKSTLSIESKLFMRKLAKDGESN